MTFLDDECRHGITSSTCSLCKSAPAKPKPSGFKKGAGIEADFEGTCPACQADILMGERIRSVDPYIYSDFYLGDVPDRAWVHVICP